MVPTNIIEISFLNKIIFLYFDLSYSQSCEFTSKFLLNGSKLEKLFTVLRTLV